MSLLAITDTTLKNMDAKYQNMHSFKIDQHAVTFISGYHLFQHLNRRIIISVQTNDLGEFFRTYKVIAIIYLVVYVEIEL